MGVWLPTLIRPVRSDSGSVLPVSGKTRLVAGQDALAQIEGPLHCHPRTALIRSTTNARLPGERTSVAYSASCRQEKPLGMESSGSFAKSRDLAGAR